MRSLWSAAGRHALRRLAADDALYAFDFDGTLSPIVAVPGEACMPSAIGDAFAALCEIATVAVITGRTLDDIRPRLSAPPHYLVGNHGAEGIPGQAAEELAAYHAVCCQWLSPLQALSGLDPGLAIECKPYSICLHLRHVQQRAAVEAEIEFALLGLDPAPVVIGGEHCVNLLPPGAPNKRLALERLLALSDKHIALYIGDDETDEWVFRAAPSDWLTIRVGPAADSAAHFFLQRQEEVATLLRWAARTAARTELTSPRPVP